MQRFYRPTFSPASTDAQGTSFDVRLVRKTYNTFCRIGACEEIELRRTPVRFISPSRCDSLLLQAEVIR